jgi:hypothetical protein
MSKPKTTIAEQLNAAQLAINNSQAENEIQALVQGFGYSAKKLTEGCDLHERARNACRAQKLAAGAQQDATQAVMAAEKVAVDAYQALAKVARAVCDPAQLAALGLSGKTPRNTAGFLAAAYNLFDNARRLNSLAEFGYNAEKLAAERAKVTACDEANQRQEAAKGAAQQATREQEAALQALNKWTAQYLKIAKVALREKPQLLEKLGIAARTSKTAAQRAALRKNEEEQAAH